MNLLGGIQYFGKSREKNSAYESIYFLSVLLQLSSGARCLVLVRAYNYCHTKNIYSSSASSDETAQ